MIEVIKFKDEYYPKFQSEGFASKFAFPFAKEVCKGRGYDIGCNRIEWAFPGAIPIDPVLDERYDAKRLPEGEVDFIFSSHCLEHVHGWVETLDHWKSHLKSGGTLFLYLPHPDQKYWLPWSNRKHVNILYPEMIEAYLKDNGFKNVFVGQRDPNHSFIAMAEKI